MTNQSNQGWRANRNFRPPLVRLSPRTTTSGIICHFFFPFFRGEGATPTANGGSQARGQIALKLQAYATATVMPDPRHICNLHHSSQQRQILSPLSRARDRTCFLTDASQIHFRWATTGTPIEVFLMLRKGAIQMWMKIDNRWENSITAVKMNSAAGTNLGDCPEA